MEQLELFEVTAANDARVADDAFAWRVRDPFYGSRGWQRARGRALDRDGARCTKCGKTAYQTPRIDVDHVIPRSVAPELGLVLTNLQVLCCDCHEAKTYLDRVRFLTNARRRAKIA